MEINFNDPEQVERIRQLATEIVTKTSAKSQDELVKALLHALFGTMNAFHQDGAEVVFGSDKEAKIMYVSIQTYAPGVKSYLKAPKVEFETPCCGNIFFINSPNVDKFLYCPWCGEQVDVRGR